MVRRTQALALRRVPLAALAGDLGGGEGRASHVGRSPGLPRLVRLEGGADAHIEPRHGLTQLPMLSPEVRDLREQGVVLGLEVGDPMHSRILQPDHPVMLRRE